MRFRRHRLGRIQQVRDWPGPDLGGLLISLCSADRAPDPAVLRDSGGFTWFYVDLVDDQGRGATLIWSWGLPFLPGYAKSARVGRPQLPIERPSVNLVVYEDGRESFYLLSELSPQECAWGEDGRSWRLGDCSFSWTDTPGAAGSAPIRTLTANLDLALPTGGRATGKLWLSGALRRDSPHVDDAAEGADGPGDPACAHLWSPMIAAVVRAPVTIQGSKSAGRSPLAMVSTPAVTSSESPGRKKPARSPVSAKMIRHIRPMPPAWIVWRSPSAVWRWDQRSLSQESMTPMRT